MTLSCLCGRLRVETVKRPDFVNECNCDLCRKAGARWGYFDPPEVAVIGEAQAYRREDKDDPAAQLGFCGHCGATTHFTLTESAVAKFGKAVIGVNMALALESELAGIELRFPDGANWAGAGEITYLREAASSVDGGFLQGLYA